eukprot:268208_1
MGGFITFVVIGFEVLLCVILCVGYKSIGNMGNLMFIHFDSDSVGLYSEYGWAYRAMLSFVGYRVVSTIAFLVSITIFANVEFSSWKADDYHIRNRNTMKDLGMFLFLYCWITHFIWPCLGVWVWRYGSKLGRHGFDRNTTSRDMKTLYSQGNYMDVLELVEFGKNELMNHEKEVLQKIAKGIGGAKADAEPKSVIQHKAEEILIKRKIPIDSDIDTNPGRIKIIDTDILKAVQFYLSMTRGREIDRDEDVESQEVEDKTERNVLTDDEKQNIIRYRGRTRILEKCIAQAMYISPTNIEVGFTQITINGLKTHIVQYVSTQEMDIVAMELAKVNIEEDVTPEIFVKELYLQCESGITIVFRNHFHLNKNFELRTHFDEQKRNDVYVRNNDEEHRRNILVKGTDEQYSDDNNELMMDDIVVETNKILN